MLKNPNTLHMAGDGGQRRHESWGNVSHLQSFGEF
jgi:hypothetical protein